MEFNAGNHLNGNINLWHESGDFTITLADGTLKPLGLQEAKLDVKLIDSQAEISSRVKGENFGLLEFNLSTALTKVQALASLYCRFTNDTQWQSPASNPRVATYATLTIRCRF